MREKYVNGKIFLSFITGILVFLALTCFFASVIEVCYQETVIKPFLEFSKGEVVYDGKNVFVGIMWLFGNAFGVESFSSKIDCLLLKIDFFVILALFVYFVLTRGLKSIKAKTINETIIVALSAIVIVIFCCCSNSIVNDACDYFQDYCNLAEIEIYESCIGFEYSFNFYIEYYAIIGGILFITYFVLFFVFYLIREKSAVKNIFVQIRKYATLREENRITEEEFQNIKNNLIDNISKTQVIKNKLEALTEFKKWLDSGLINEYDFSKLKKWLLFKGE